MIRVLVVEDDPQLVELYAVMLKDVCTIVARAHDGVTGIERALAMHTDLVLLDLAMPGMDGLELLVRLREAAPERRVLVISGFDRKVLAPIVTGLGAVGYVQKGDAPEDVRAAIIAAAAQDPPPFRPPGADRLARFRAILR